MATLTSVYADSTIVIGPLATQREPEAYDLCLKHVESFTAPRGWQVIRLAESFEPAPPSEDDLLALADAVRDASRAPGPRAVAAQAGWQGTGSLPAPLTGPSPASRPGEGSRLPAPVADGEIGRRGHLRVLRGQKED